MKTCVQLIFTCLISLFTYAQEKPVKIVFDVTSNNTKVHQSTIRHVKAMSKLYPDSKFEVVMYGGAMEMVLKDKSLVAEDMETLAEKDNIEFVICQGTMRRHKADTSQLIKGVNSVPDGILELAQKQQEGWSYIKEGQ